MGTALFWRAKSEFALAPHGKHEDRVQFGHEPIKRHIAASACCNYEFAFTICNWPPDERAGFQHVECGND